MCQSGFFVDTLLVEILIFIRGQVILESTLVALLVLLLSLFHFRSFRGHFEGCIGIVITIDLFRLNLLNHWHHFLERKVVEKELVFWLFRKTKKSEYLLRWHRLLTFISVEKEEVTSTKCIAEDDCLERWLYTRRRRNAHLCTWTQKQR